MHAVAFNPTDGPVVIDDDGRTVEGGGFAAVDTTVDPVKAAVDADPPRLVLRKAPFDGLDDAPADVRAVFEEVERLEAERKTDTADDAPPEAPTRTSGTTRKAGSR